MLLSLTPVDHFSAARRAEDALLIAPCAVADVQPVDTLREGLVSLLQSVAETAATRLHDSPPERPLLGCAHRLDALRSSLVSQVLRHDCLHHFPTDDVPADDHEDDDCGVVESILARDAAPRPTLRKIEQTLQRDTSNVANAARLVADALGQESPPAPWPPHVDALRLRRFTPVTDLALPADEPLPSSSRGRLSRVPRAPKGLGGLVHLAQRLHSSPASHSSRFDVGMERQLLPRAPACSEAEDARFRQEVAAFLFSSSRAPSDAYDGSTATARTLAPLSSARQRSERTQRLIKAVMAPAATPEQPRSRWPRILFASACADSGDAPHKEARGGDGSVPAAIEAVLLRQAVPAPSPCELRRFLNGRAVRQGTTSQPASGVQRDVLDAHMAALVHRLLKAGDAASQVRSLPVENVPADEHSATTDRFVDDGVVGSLMTPWPAADSQRASAGFGPTGNSIAGVVGIDRAELLTYRRSLGPGALATTAGTAASSAQVDRVRGMGLRIVAGYGTANVGVEDHDDAVALGAVAPPVDEDEGADAIAFAGANGMRGHAGANQGATAAMACPVAASSVPSGTNGLRDRTVSRLPAADAPTHERTTSADDVRPPSGAFVMSLHESFSESVDAFLQISHGIAPPKRPNNTVELGAEAGSHGAQAAAVRQETLPSKLRRHAQGSTGLLALLPEGVTEHVPLMAAMIIDSLARADPVSILWVLPDAMVAAAQSFWQQFVRCTPPRTEAPPVRVRALDSTPITNASATPLGPGELGFCSLSVAMAAAAALEGANAASEGATAATPPAALVVLTAPALDVSTASSLGRVLIGTPPRGRVVALLCGLPMGGASSLAPLCAALGVRRLLLRSEFDPDVSALRATRRSVAFAVPARLKAPFETLVLDAQKELNQLLHTHPELTPLPFESCALKARIEQFNAARRPGSMPDGEARIFWSLLACFCARRLLDCAEDADADAFSAFMSQVSSQKQSKLTLTFARRESLKAVLVQREELSTAIATFQRGKLNALSAALQSALRSGFGKADLHLGAGRHGVITLRQTSRAHAVVHACEAALQGSLVRVHHILPEAGASHVRNLVQRAAAANETLLLILGQPDLQALLMGKADAPGAEVGASAGDVEGSAARSGGCGSVSGVWNPAGTGCEPSWRSFAYLVEYDALPNETVLAAQSQVVHGIPTNCRTAARAAERRFSLSRSGSLTFA